MSGSNTDDSDINMNRTGKRTWRSEQQASTNTNEAIENLKIYFDSKFDDIQQQFLKRKRETCQKNESGFKT